MWKRQKFLNWNPIRFIQTLGTAHQASRSLNYTGLVSEMFGTSTETGNVLSEIESQGFRIQRASATGNLKLKRYPSGNALQRLNDTSSTKSALKRAKGQPEGSAVTGKTWKPWVAKWDLVSSDAADQNNSNLTSLTALVVNGEWELVLASSSHYCFYTIQPFFIISATHMALIEYLWELSKIVM